MTDMTNIFADIPEQSVKELFTPLLQQNGILIERIVSQGQRTPDGKWYHQAYDEWVMVIQGQAVLRYEQEQLTLNTGDCLLIPAHTKHRVEWTDPKQNTIWLAIHLKQET